VNFKRLGNIGIGLTVALLMLNLYLNRERNSSPLGVGPDGFPWPTDGLGRVTVGMEGSFRIELEERQLTADGTERVPKITIVGKDPGPGDNGMTFREALVTSLSTDSNSETAQVIARAPQAWAAVITDENGTTLDRSKPWKMIRPTVRFPALAGEQEFVLTTDLALLDPTTNEVHCPGPFQLASTGMKFNGIGLRLDPKSGEIHFGEQDGNLDWEIAMGSTPLRGHTDGGGSFAPVAGSDGMHVLTLAADKSCTMIVPNSGGEPGRMETGGFDVYLTAGDGNWRPHSLAGVGDTYWTGGGSAFSGGTVDGTWKENGEWSGLLIDGPILGQVFQSPELGTLVSAQTPGTGWLSANGGVWIQPEEGLVELWDRINVNLPIGMLQAQRATFTGDNQFQAGGDPFLLSQHGMVYAESLTSVPDSTDLLATQVLAYPAGNKFDAVNAPSVVLTENGNIFSPRGFDMAGVQNGDAWQLSGNQLTATSRNVPIRATAKGAVEWKLKDGRILGERVEVLSNGQIAARGNPMLAAFPIQGGSAIGTAKSCFLFDEKLCLSGDPSVDFPASALNLKGSRCLVAADMIFRKPDGTWLFIGGVKLSGAFQGTAQELTLYPDGSMEFERTRHDQPFVATSLTGQMIEVSAEWILLHPEGKIEMKIDIEAKLTGADGIAQRLTGSFGEISLDSGWVTGEANVWSHELHASSHRIWWDTDEFGKTAIHLEGNAQFDHPDAKGRAHRLDVDPDTQEIELHRNKRRQAWLHMKDGRLVEADWIRLDPVNLLLSSRHGTVTKVPPPK
jgi:hypothetical protein